MITIPLGQASQRVQRDARDGELHIGRRPSIPRGVPTLPPLEMPLYVIKPEWSGPKEL